MVSIDELFYGTGVSGLTEIERLQKKYNDFADNVSVFKVGMNPLFMPVPSWWQGNFTQKGWTPAWQIPHRHSGNPYTNDEALQYLDIAEKAYQLKLAWRTAQCESEGQRGVYCSYVSDIQGTLGGIHVLQNAVRIAKEQNLQHGVVGFDPNFKTFEVLPEVFAEEDPSILQSDEVVTVTPGALTWYYVKKPSGICERLNVSQNFVDRMTSQGWIFSLTDICVTSPPPPPTEPGQVNWIPEPFFSLINNVFRR